MKQYFSEGLLPYEYVEEAFNQLLTIKSGTIGEAFSKVAKVMSLEYREQYYDYIYELEPYINEFIRQNTSASFTLMEAIPLAVESYLLDVFHDNLYTFLENYVEKMLFEQGLSKPEVDALNIPWFIGYADNGTSLVKLRRNAKKLIPTAY